MRRGGVGILREAALQQALRLFGTAGAERGASEEVVEARIAAARTSKGRQEIVGLLIAALCHQRLGLRHVHVARRDVCRRLQ